MTYEQKMEKVCSIICDHYPCFWRTRDDICKSDESEDGLRCSNVKKAEAILDALEEMQKSK